MKQIETILHKRLGDINLKVTFKTMGHVDEYFLEFLKMKIMRPVLNLTNHNNDSEQYLQIIKQQNR